MGNVVKILIWAWRRFAAFASWWTPAANRLASLLSDLRRSDGDARPSPWSAANTCLSHEAIGLWMALGLLTVWAPAWLAVIVPVVIWGGLWEAVQYRRQPSARVLQDWLIGDLPSYAVGAVAIAVVVGPAAGGVWREWLAVTPFVVLWPGINAAIFGRLPGE